MMIKIVLPLALMAVSSNAFSIQGGVTMRSVHRTGHFAPIQMSEGPIKSEAIEVDPMEQALDDLDDETKRQMEKARRAQELRDQEVFMKKSTGKHQCTNCDWEYDQEKGDSMMIGGMIKPGTEFKDLPADWRCPVCRAAKDAFKEVVEEIPGFAVNQGYGFGTNSWTAGQKNLAIFGGLAVFFFLFLGGYALS
jgi:rubredoxin